jgi:isoaspartyl peptidase/L-asparaginase-like protein (Ntn-hydrolase superfamily)
MPKHAEPGDSSMKKFFLAAIAAAITIPAASPDIALAQTRDDREYRDRDYRRTDREYRGDDRRYEYRCKQSSGTTGLVAGGAGGALAGNALGGGLLGTVAGGLGGALLGKHLDKKHDEAQNRRNGC